ncbi:MAG: type II toxin-antitoxin system VapC family toxin [Chitinophagaceae bacterium]|nr:type II toxin-antitoxin system VapC family toxin [Chitinophagaceae bacterium]
MANKIVVADTSILIDYFRKSEKANLVLVSLYDKGFDISISAITEYEIYSGATPNQIGFWENLLKETVVLPFDHFVVKIAVEINSALKRKRKQIEQADLFIAATAMANNLPFATLNKRHFERIDDLIMHDEL